MLKIKSTEGLVKKMVDVLQKITSVDEGLKELITCFNLQYILDIHDRDEYTSSHLVQRLWNSSQHCPFHNLTLSLVPGQIWVRQAECACNLKGKKKYPNILDNESYT